MRLTTWLAIFFCAGAFALGGRFGFALGRSDALAATEQRTEQARAAGFAQGMKAVVCVGGFRAQVEVAK